MTAANVIAQIKALAPGERSKVLDFLLEIEAAEQTTRMDDHRFEQAADRVLGRHAELLRKLAQ